MCFPAGHSGRRPWKPQAPPGCASLAVSEGAGDAPGQTRNPPGLPGRAFAKRSGAPRVSVALIKHRGRWNPRWPSTMRVFSGRRPPNAASAPSLRAAAHTLSRPSSRAVGVDLGGALQGPLFQNPGEQEACHRSVFIPRPLSLLSPTPTPLLPSAPPPPPPTAGRTSEWLGHRAQARGGLRLSEFHHGHPRAGDMLSPWEQEGGDSRAPLAGSAPAPTPPQPPP